MDDERAVVLGGGGATAIAWELGVADGLAAAGVDVRVADRIIGTSAGALAGTKLALGTGWDDIRTWVSTPQEFNATMSPFAAARLFSCQLVPDRHRALVRFARSLLKRWTPQAEADWIAYAAGDLDGVAWPGSLVVTTVNALTGAPACWTAAGPVGLDRAVAASCALPGVFPPVRLPPNGTPHIDGGMRSPANVDLAGDAKHVIALAPSTGAMQRWRRPENQASSLPGKVCLITPDDASRKARGLDHLDTRRGADVFAAGREQGLTYADKARAVWG